MCVSDLRDKEYATDRIHEVLERKQTTRRELSSIAGVLTWISFVFLPGKPRRQHIYEASSGSDKSATVTLKGAVLRQLQWWYHTLKSDKFVGTRIWNTQDSPSTMLLRSDASGEDGWGVCMRKSFPHRRTVVRRVGVDSHALQGVSTSGDCVISDLR